MTEIDHFEYLLVVLFSWAIVPEERFDAIALDHLRHYRAEKQLKGLKDRMVLHAHAYRLTVRGRNYLVRLRLAGEVGGRPAMTVLDVLPVLDRLAELAAEGTPPKRRQYY